MSKQKKDFDLENIDKSLHASYNQSLAMYEHEKDNDVKEKNIAHLEEVIQSMHDNLQRNKNRHF